MKKVIAFSLILFCCIGLFNCSKDKAQKIDDHPYGGKHIQASQQRTGDPAAGFDYLINGDYMNSGIPYDIYLSVFGENHTNHLNRTGDNAVLRYDFTAVDAPNGVRLVVPNCLQCHAKVFNGELIVGLGNTTYDFTQDASVFIPLVENQIKQKYGENSPEMEAFIPFKNGTNALGSNILTEVKGVNAADKIGVVLAAYRDKHSLEWSEDPLMDVSPLTVATDIPPWWVLKRKNAMFYTGSGRGDYSRYLMLSILLSLHDSTYAKTVDERFPDIQAYINSLQPPVFPKSIDHELAEKGRVVFNANCSTCHGTYGNDYHFPNLLIPLDVVKTDPALSQSYTAGISTPFIDWFNNGWFGKQPHGAKLVAEGGYVAQPLDGIWATAPYLHNGSVPTLEDLLNSVQRPTYWKRTFETDDYDFDKVGWNYTELSAKADNNTYDTTIPGYGNQGHYFGDHLSAAQRKAVIEYLKTL